MIAAKRHIHLDPAAAEKFSLNDKQVVCVKLESDGRSLTFGDVVVRVSLNLPLLCILIPTNPTLLD